MLKAAFITLRVLTGIASLAAFAGTMVVIFVTGAFRLLKGAAHAAISVAKLFASGFQHSDPASPVPHLVSLPLVGLAVLFLSMFTSVFTPGGKIFLHIVAAMALAAAAWRIWTMVHQSDNQLYYLPVIALWFIYYGVCLRYGGAPTTPQKT
jgi:hypothetical protein